MASIRTVTPMLRRSGSVLQTPLRFYQRRWAQVHDVRFVATHQPSDRVLEKYKAKLEQKAKQEGKSNVDELKEAYKEKIHHLRKKAAVPGATAPLSAQEAPTPPKAADSVPYQPPPPPEPQKSASPGKTKDGVKTLDSFIDVQKATELQPKEIEAGWRLMHARDAQSLCAVVNADTFTRMASNAGKHPQFILPLPREGQGAEIHFLQWTFPSPTTATVLFTHLAEFKLRGEYAQPHTTITHHLDLMKTNGLVLMEGRVTENRGISADEAKWLLMCLQKFYGFEAHTQAAKTNLEKRRKLMEQFSGGDAAFNLDELLEEAEKVP